MRCYCGRSFARGNAWDSHVKTCPAAAGHAGGRWRRFLSTLAEGGIRLLSFWVLAVPAVVAGIAVARLLGLLEVHP